MFGLPWLNAVMFSGLFIVFGLALEPVYRVVERSSRGASSIGETQVMRYVVWLLALVATLDLAVIMFAAVRIPVLDPRLASSIELAATSAGVAAIVILGGAVLRELLGRSRLAEVALAAVVLVGAIRAVEAITRIAMA